MNTTLCTVALQLFVGAAATRLLNSHTQDLLLSYPFIVLWKK